MKYVKMILKKLLVMNNSHFEAYVLEKEFSVPTVHRSYRG